MFDFTGRLRKLFFGAFRSAKQTVVGKKAGTRLRLESLEERVVPANITVNSLADGATAFGQVTLRQAIQAAKTDTSVNGSTAGSGADTILFSSSLFTGGPATINLASATSGQDGLRAFSITTQITIEGPTGNNGLTLAGNNTFGLFDVASTGSLTLQNLTLTGGTAQGGTGYNGGGGGVFNQGSLIVSNSTFTVSPDARFRRRHGHGYTALRGGWLVSKAVPQRFGGGLRQ